MGVCIYKTGGAKEGESSSKPKNEWAWGGTGHARWQFWVGKELAKMMMRLWTRLAGAPSGEISDGHGGWGLAGSDG